MGMLSSCICSTLVSVCAMNCIPNEQVHVISRSELQAFVFLNGVKAIFMLKISSYVRKKITVGVNFTTSPNLRNALKLIQ